MKPGDRIIREPERREKTGLGQTRWWQLEKAGKAPRRVQVSDRAVGWYESELDEWVASRPRVSGNQPERLRKAQA